MAHVDFTETVLEDPIGIKFHEPTEALIVSSDSAPIYSRVRRPGGDALVLQVRLDKTDLAARGSLPVLVADALRAFDVQPARWQRSVTTADLVAIQPAPVRRQLLPPATAAASPADASRWAEPESTIAGPLDWVGVWQLVPAPTRWTRFNRRGARCRRRGRGAAGAGRPSSVSSPLVPKRSRRGQAHGTCRPMCQRLPARLPGGAGRAWTVRYGPRSC